jgi:Domain of unknown function (DUF4476)
MKTIFTLLTSLVLSITVFATDAKPKSMLTISSSDGGDIRVIIDGRRFEPNDNYLRIQDVEAGYHSLKIYREKNSGLFILFGKRYEVVFSNSISIKPRTNVMIAVDRFGKATVNESRVNGWFDHGNRGFGNQDTRNWDNDHDFDFDRGGSLGDYDNGHDGKIGNDGSGYNENVYNRAITDFEFNTVLSAMQKEWSEANRAKSAAQIISTNYLTAFQVKQMLQLFSFENNKLDLAKQAYSKTVDQKNYFMINDVFCSDGSKDELARYIRSCE